jgi:hypothetical protein
MLVVITGSISTPLALSPLVVLMARKGAEAIEIATLIEQLPSQGGNFRSLPPL